MELPAHRGVCINVMRTLRALSLLIALAAFAVPSTSFGQSFFLWRGTITAGGTDIGTVKRIAVQLEWIAPTEALVTYRDESIVLTGSVSTSNDVLVVGVGEEVELRARDGWRIKMMPGTWAPVIEEREGEIHIDLPGGLPVKTAWLQTPVAGVETEPEKFLHDHDKVLMQQLHETKEKGPTGAYCENKIFLNNKQHSRSFTNSCAGFYNRIVSWEYDGAWAEVIFYWEGFAVEGYKKERHCGSTSCGRSTRLSDFERETERPSVARTLRRIRSRTRIPAGTVIYPTSSSAEHFALLLRPMISVPSLLPDDGGHPSMPPRHPFRMKYKKGRREIALLGHVKLARGSLPISD